VIIMADSHPHIEVYETTGGSCLDSSGKIKTDGSCTQGNVVFGTGVETRVFWILIEDTAALCKTAVNGERRDTVNPDDAACTFAVRQSAPTGSSVAISSEAGVLSDSPVTSILNSIGHIEFFVTLTSDAENEEDNVGAFELAVTSPRGNKVTTGFFVTDPAF